jgi:hypothetical protein
MSDLFHAGVPFFFKQWGAHDAEGRRVGKGRAGRTPRRPRLGRDAPAMIPAESSPSVADPLIS